MTAPRVSTPRVSTPRVVASVGAVVGIAAVLASPGRANLAFDQCWPAFVLVLGLLLLGFAAAEDGTFGAAARLLARVPGGRWPAYVLSMVLVATTSVLLNLDTAVAFLTPVVVLLAREHGADERPFLYGCVLMSNSASLLLPGSNLTNLIVLGHEHSSGLTFAGRIWPAWVVAVVITAAVPALIFRRRPTRRPDPPEADRPRQPGATLVVVPLAAVALLALSNPAFPVLALGVVAVLVVRAQGRTTLRRLSTTVDVATLGGLFGLAVGAGTLARVWTSPTRWLAHAGRWSTALFATGAAVAFNNLPAAMLLSANTPAHPRALLVGLDLGPNIAVTGSLSALLWIQAARSVSSPTSIRLYTVVGALTALLAIPCAVLLTR